MNNTTTAAVKKVVTPSALVLSKRLASANNKAELKTLAFQLNQAKKHAGNFVTELQAKYGIKVYLKDIETLAKQDLTSSTVFAEFLTEKMQLVINEKGWSFSRVLTLTANYFKAKAAK
jgi:spore germination protein YaaH